MNFKVSLSHNSQKSTIFIERETSSRYRVIEFPESMVPLAEILAEEITVPTQAKDHLMSLIQKVSPVLSIQADGDVIQDLPARAGGTTPCLQISPLKNGQERLKIELWVGPFADPIMDSNTDSNYNGQSDPSSSRHENKGNGYGERKNQGDDQGSYCRPG